MNDELFQIEPAKSPRLKWMERHHIKVEDSPPNVCGIDGSHDFVCFHGMKAIAYGKTPEDAIFKAAKSLNIRLWNEE